MAGEIPPAQPPPGPPPRPLLWRWRRNPLRRRTDALRAWLGHGVLITVLAVAPVVAVLVADAARSHYEDTVRHQKQTRTATTSTSRSPAPATGP